MNEQKIEPCLLSKWNHSISSQKAQEEMRRLLSRRKPRRLFHDLLHRQQEGGGSKLPHQVFLTTCALFCRGQDPSQEILQAIQTAHLEKMLCVGFRLFLCNKSKQRQFTIQWTDQTFPNRYAWLTRFSGEFYSSAFEELFSTARLISQLDPDRLWEIAKEDPNDLLLLNWPDIFWEFPSTARALELLQPAQSPRRQALAFWWLTFPLQDSPQSEERAREILREASGVQETILTPLLYAFLLHQHSCPQAFRSHLIKTSRHSILGQEIKKGALHRNWHAAAAAAALIREIPSRRRRESLWKGLMSGVEENLETGRFPADPNRCREFLQQLPPPHREHLCQELMDQFKTLHTAEIDRLVRPQIFQHDASRRADMQEILNSAAQ